MEHLQYPVGRFDYPGSPTATELASWVQEIKALPRMLRQAVEGLSEGQLDTTYRPGGWTVRQVVHHIADSHLNSFTRFKLALTEDNPTIRPYEEHLWAELPDAKNAPVEISLKLLEALHARWLLLLRSLKPADLQRSFLHPASGQISLEKAIAMYAWHGRHHLAHITTLKKREGWYSGESETQATP